MSIIQLKTTPWDKVFEVNLDKTSKRTQEIKFKKGDYWIIKIDSHTDLAEIVGQREGSEEKKDEKETEEISLIRRATDDDFNKVKEKEIKKKEFFKKAEEIIKKSNSPIKLIDLHISFDGGKIVFAFIAPERIDFRNLVKKLSQEFHRSIRLHQINPREEVKIFPSIGPCGYQLCCLGFLKTLGGVRTTFIEEQQLQHRGVERLSGVCGRLKCCLAFEKNFYQEQIKKMPSLGQRIIFKGKEAEVVAWHILKGTVDLKIGKSDTIVEVEVEKIINNK